MKPARWSLALLLAACIPSSRAASQAESDVTHRQRPELDYLRAVNTAGPPRDPTLLFLLMGQYANANRAAEGATFLSERLRQFGPQLSAPQRSLYVAAIGLLRARQAGEVSFWKRIGWVKETIGMLEEAKRLSGGKIFVVRWIAGVVDAQLPGFFDRREAARADLTWCLEHVDLAPHPGWLREVHRQLGAIARAEGNAPLAAEQLRRSGLGSFDQPITLTTEFVEELVSGHAFTTRRIVDVVPGKVYALSGFEFTDYHFVVSQDRRELIAIDAGTRADSAEAAYQALRAHVPGLPPLTTVFVTHAHWDHIGGHRYFDSLTPKPRFYASSRYPEELALAAAAPELFATQFFGEQFRPDDVRGFKADVTIDRPTVITVGGTKFELTPVQGGETTDALLINVPEHGVMFAGDVMMPYLGAPFVAEGSLEGLLQTIDVVVAAHPTRLIHGHEPITRLFPTPATLVSLKPHLIWLGQTVTDAVRHGQDRAQLQQANLIPPTLLADPTSQVAYLVMRENVINRLYDQKTGYWQPNLDGVDYLSRADRGDALVDYLGVSERQAIKAATRMVADGKYELAVSLLESIRGRFPGTATVETLAYLKLAEKYQDFNPFKFIIYAHKAGLQVPPLDESSR